MSMKRVLVSGVLAIAACIWMASDSAFAQSPVIVEGPDMGVYYHAETPVNCVTNCAPTRATSKCAATGNCRPRLNNGVIDTPFEKMLFPRAACCPWNNPIAIRCRR